MGSRERVYNYIKYPFKRKFRLISSLMATQTDLLKTLPPELRQYIYSYLFPADGKCTVRIGQSSRSEPWLSAILALSEDDVYLNRRRRGTVKGPWPKEIDEAFFQGL